MTVEPFRRLSAGPTIPELLRAERVAWVCAGQTRACLAGAGAVLRMARVLLRLGLVEPDVAGLAFLAAHRLAQTGMRSWRRRRLACGRS